MSENLLRQDTNDSLIRAVSNEGGCSVIPVRSRNHERNVSSSCSHLAIVGNLLRRICLGFFLVSCASADSPRLLELGLQSDSNKTIFRLLPEKRNYHGKLVLSFDDWYISEWYEALPLLREQNAKVTFFVSRYDDFILCSTCGSAKKLLAAISEQGHSIEFHGLDHANAVGYVAEYGLNQYLKNEILDGITLMEQDGYRVSSFAYPYGAHNEDINAGALSYFRILRGFSGGEANISNIRSGLQEATTADIKSFVMSQSIDNPYFVWYLIEDAMRKASYQDKYLFLSSHGISAECGKNGRAYCITPSRLAKVLEFANALNMEIITFRELL